MMIQNTKSQNPALFSCFITKFQINSNAVSGYVTFCKERVTFYMLYFVE